MTQKPITERAVFIYHRAPAGKIEIRSATGAAAAILPQPKLIQGRADLLLEQQCGLARTALDMKLPPGSLLLPDASKFECNPYHVEAALSHSPISRPGMLAFGHAAGRHLITVLQTPEHLTIIPYRIKLYEDASDESILVYAIFHLADKEIINLQRKPLATPPFAASDDMDTLIEKFWKNVNPALEDPFVGDPDSDFEFYRFDQGSQDHLERDSLVLVEAWLSSHPEILQQPYHHLLDIKGKLHVEFESNGTDGSIGGPVRKNNILDRAPEAVMKALTLIFAENSFTGCWPLYNDGRMSRRSGYNLYPSSVFIQLEDNPNSAHDFMRLAARSRPKALAWLRNRQFSIAEIEEILGTLQPGE